MDNAETKRQLQKWVDTLVENGSWWKNSSRDTYIKMATVLIDFGVPFEKATSILASAYYAASAEYGN